MNLFEEIIFDISESKSAILILILLIAVGIMLILREVRCWYWKINDRISLQCQEIDALQEIIDLQKMQIRLLESNISKMNLLIYNTVAIEEAASTKDTPE